MVADGSGDLTARVGCQGRVVDDDPSNMPHQLALSTTQELRGLVPAAFNEAAMREGLSYVRRRSFPAVELTLEQLLVLGDVELAERHPAGCAVLLRVGPDMLVQLVAGRGHGEIEAAGRDRDEVDAVVADLVGALREAEPTDGEVPITFLANASGRMIEPRRRICAPAWSEMRDNYSPPARKALDTLMAAREPGPGGLLLWHGEPGTGKSYALRALAREWRGWCDTHFITDADAFLGRQTSYLLSALLRSNRGVRGEHRWRLVVLEDAGELLAADARAVAGQGLSRLLNVSDGLLGEGLRVVVLVTTNEPLRQLHPAVVRPGRTWVEVEFGMLSGREANEWLGQRNVEQRVECATSLAELFAIAGGRRLARRTRLGFGA
jgi:hypothetical protein